MPNALELRQKRAALVAEARAILEAAEKEKRELAAEETEKYDRIMAEVDKLAKDIEREERVASLEREIAKPQGTVAARKEQPGDGQEQRDLRASDEYRGAFWKNFRHGKQALMGEEYRALNVGTDGAGGYLVPTEFERTLIEKLTQENVIRSLATIIESSTDRQIPVVETEGVAYWTAEQAAFTESDDAFGQKLLSAHKLTVLMRVSEELLQDSAFDLEAYVARKFAKRAGMKEEDAFVVGDGVGKPRGVTLDCQVGVTAASATAVAADEVIDLLYSLGRPYRLRSTWLVADSTVKALRKLKDADNQYIWQPGLQSGEPDRLLGRPLVVSAAMPAIGASNKSILIGDFSYYWIADRVGAAGRVFQRLNELYATTGQVGFRAYQRVDGLLALPEAVKALQHPAA